MGRLSQQLTVPAELAGWRADRVIAALLDVSRADARRCFDEGSVVRAGVPLRPSDRMAEDDVLSVEVAEASDRLAAEPISFGVVFEDEWLAVIDKPAGLVVHPGAGHARGTLVGGLLHRWPGIEGVGEHPRWGIVHRLDRETSGALLVAKTAEAYEPLRAAIGRREVSRHYRCLVHGSFAAPTGSIEAPIGRDPTQPTRQRVAVGGRPSITHYSVADVWAHRGLSLLAVRLETGRTHQIRVHFESIGHHVVGDPVYGRPGPPDVDPGRVWLHADRLVFDHPITRLPVEAAAPLADDLVASLDALGPPDPT